jgi:hypothetical protein
MGGQKLIEKIILRGVGVEKLDNIKFYKLIDGTRNASIDWYPVLMDVNLEANW